MWIFMSFAPLQAGHRQITVDFTLYTSIGESGFINNTAAESEGLKEKTNFFFWSMICYT